MRIIGLAGWSGAGKTTLMAKLLPELVARGVSVSTMKHAHHDFDIDKPGKDSFVHRQAGAHEVLVASGTRFALMHELRDEPEPGMEDLLRRMAPVDLVVIEGFKAGPHPKLEVWRQENGKPFLHPDDPTIRAVATDAGLSDLPIPVLDLNDAAAIADFLLAEASPVFLDQEA